MSQFKVGDVCIGQNCTIQTRRNGMECTIIGGLEMREGRHPTDDSISTAMRYLVKWEDGHITVAAPHYLRRKEPPKRKREIDTVVPWSDCLWRPSHVQVPA